MRLAKVLLLSIPVLALALSHAGAASACGGFFPDIQQTETTQVAGHKMILSISQTQTTLWDQVSYSGDPSSFAWVLPIKGVVDVGLSADSLFQFLDFQTSVIVASPTISCDRPPSCGTEPEDRFLGGGGGSSTPPPVTVTITAHAVVGPYETVQLHSSDPAALSTWLTDHNFAIPADIKPLIDSYVSDGFDFLAMKLIPGKDVTAMRPVRVTMPGASPVLPLRMVAAGTGATTPVSLLVVGEGRYEAASMPNLLIDPAQLVWDWDTQSGNYAAVEKAMLAANQGKAWLVESAANSQGMDLQGYIVSNPDDYKDDQGNGGPAGAQAEVTALFGTLDPKSIWITRLHGELSREALAKDLTLGASTDQTPVSRVVTIKNTTGNEPVCPVYLPCPSGCAVTQVGGVSSMLGGLSLAALALVLARRRKGR